MIAQQLQSSITQIPGNRHSTVINLNILFDSAVSLARCRSRDVARTFPTSECVDEFRLMQSSSMQETIFPRRRGPPRRDRDWLTASALSPVWPYFSRQSSTLLTIPASPFFFFFHQLSRPVIVVEELYRRAASRRVEYGNASASDANVESHRTRTFGRPLNPSILSGALSHFPVAKSRYEHKKIGGRKKKRGGGRGGRMRATLVSRDDARAKKYAR